MSRLCVALLSALVLEQAYATIYFQEQFDNDWEKRWVISDWKEGSRGKVELSSGKWSADAAKKGLRTTEDAKFYALSSNFKKVLNNKDKTVVVQFSIKHEQKIDCGGGYVKILPPGLNQKDFKGDSEYAIMFGPDICGYSTKKVHVIFTHGGTNLLTKKDIKCEDDEFTHVYTLVLNADDSYEVLIDGDSKHKGTLSEDFEFEKPKKIKDPKAEKPKDWVDEEYMDDPDDKKPDDWEKEPKEIADPDAKKPDDWDDEDDGEWEAPMKPNPKYKGEWKPKRIKNPAYKGPWVHPEIDNPEYTPVADKYLRGDMGVVGIDIWQVKSGSIFNDFIITDSVEEAEAFRKANKVDADKEKSAKEAYDKAQADAAKPSSPPTDKSSDDDTDDEDTDLEDLDKDKEKAKKDEKPSDKSDL